MVLQWIVTLAALTTLLSCSSGMYYNYLPPGVVCNQDHDPYPMDQAKAARFTPGIKFFSLLPEDGDLANLPAGDYQYLSSNLIYVQARENKKNPGRPNNLIFHARETKVGNKLNTAGVCANGFDYSEITTLDTSLKTIKSFQILPTKQIVFEGKSMRIFDQDRMQYQFEDLPSGTTVYHHPNQIFGREKTQYILSQPNPQLPNFYEIRGRVDRNGYSLLFSVQLERKDFPATNAAVANRKMSN